MQSFETDLHVYAYLEKLERLYGDTYLQFEPETLGSEIQMTGRTLDRIMAGIVLKTTSTFWNDIVVFEKIALALNNRSVLFTEYQDLSPAEMAWAVTEAGLITHPEPLDDDVEIYIAKKLHDEGYNLAPFPLGEVQKQLDLINKKTVLSTEVEENRQIIQREKHDIVNDYIMQHMITLLKEIDG